VEWLRLTISSIARPVVDVPTSARKAEPLTLNLDPSPTECAAPLGCAGRPTVLIVDDHPSVRHALESLLRSDPALELVGSAHSGEEAVRLAAQLRPQVIVMDLTMPGVNGVEATRRVRAQQRPPTVVALSGSHELMREAVAAGAAFTVLKDEDPQRLLEVIQTASGA
jgi:DNA-binding NarL/FixJ family response regulator